MSQRSRSTNTSLSHRSGSVALAAIAVVWLAACAPTDSGVTSPPLPGTDVAPLVGMTAAFGEPFRNLTADQLALFTAGKADLAVARGDLNLPENAESVAILRKNVVVLWAPSGRSIR